MKARSVWLAMLLVLTACSVPPPTQTPHAVPLVIVRAEQVDPPALIAWPGGGWLAMWIGADAAGVHHDARVISFDAATILRSPIVLPLPPRRPRAQTLIAGGDDTSVRLLWLDADENNQARLFAATLASDDVDAPRVRRGPTPISTVTTFDYAVVVADDGTAWTAWIGGNAASPSLYAQAIDSESRPQPPIRIEGDARTAAIALAPDGVRVVWERGADGVLCWQSILFRESTCEVTIAPYRAPGDRLLAFRAGSGGVFGVLIWEIERSDGARETWMTAGGWADALWETPRLLTFTPGETASATGTRARAMTAREGGAIGVRGARPLNAVRDPLPLAVYTAAGVGVLWLSGGAVSGYTAGASASVIRAPIAAIDRSGAAVLAWADVGVGAPAALTVMDLVAAGR